MKDQTSVVYIQSKQGLVAGLSWQPLLSKSIFQRMSEVRRNALMIDCDLYALVKSGKQASGGFDDYDEGLAQEERKLKQYSFAAAMCKAYQETDTIVAWRVRTGQRIGEIALVVIEGGMPTLDIIVSESEAISMMEYYQQSRDRAQLFRIVSNDTSLWVADEFIENEAEFTKKHTTGDARINTIPLDYKTLLQATIGVFLLLGFLMGYDYYLAETKKRELAAQIASQDNSAQYATELDSRLGQVGLNTESYIRLLNAVYDLPFYINGWAMRSIDCSFSVCTMQWSSVGGYTDQIAAAFDAKDGYVVQINRTTPSEVSIVKDFKINLTGPSTWVDLPNKPDTDQWVLNQRQVYERSRVDINMFSEPEIWPTGYTNIPMEQAVTRYRFNMSGGVAIAESFITGQKQAMYWDKLGMTITNLEAAGPRIQLKLEGAYYAY
ncbi:type 4b pilus protein PilO2 [Limnobacter parvus]|uniref:Uncharacterized protein n=1 Tax=Limnobacter parvus TaxID=2939690 RepID=A0ABT1XJY2_9BURK|nr:hypothetical protein [Limnobacter parvus]MCR2747606.1 hypothetical protein [Limnobacter parvus]